MANVQPTLVMLDLDGTLIDSIGVFLSGLPAAAAQHGVPITPSDVFQDWGSGQLPGRGLHPEWAVRGRGAAIQAAP